MKPIKINIKPISVNQAHNSTGRVYKSASYKAFEEQARLLLLANPIPKLSKGSKLKLTAIFGVSCKFDLDNCVKCFLDVLEKIYGFNDRNVEEIHIRKHRCKRGEEFIEFSLCELGIDVEKSFFQPTLFTL